MQIKIEPIKQLIKEKFRNNQAWFAEEIDINKHYFNRILRGTEKPTSPKACSGVIKYCKKNNLDYQRFISLD